MINDDERLDDRALAATSSAKPNQPTRSRCQVSLIDLIGAVLGLGITFGLAIRLSPTRGRNEYVLLALVLMPFLIWICIRLIWNVRTTL
jgi:hypothetical protein